jgi:hypothetical protein
LYAFFVSNARYIISLSYSSYLYHTGIWWSLPFMKFSLFTLLHCPVASSVFSNASNLCYSRNVRDQVSHPYKTIVYKLILHSTKKTFHSL